MPLSVPPELTILLINSIIIAVLFFIVLPKVAVNNMKLIAINDGLATSTALVIAATLFMNKGLAFNAILMQLNWFWFSLLSYFCLEAPFMWHYLKQVDTKS